MPRSFLRLSYSIVLSNVVRRHFPVFTSVFHQCARLVYIRMCTSTTMIHTENGHRVDLART